MATAWNKKQGGVQPSGATGRDPKNQGGEPTTGFVQAPKSEKGPSGAGPGVGNTRKGIR